MLILSSHLLRSVLFLVFFPIKLSYAFVTPPCVLQCASRMFTSLKGGAVWNYMLLSVNITLIFNNAICVFAPVKRGILLEWKGRLKIKIAEFLLGCGALYFARWSLKFHRNLLSPIQAKALGWMLIKIYENTRRHIWDCGIFILTDERNSVLKNIVRNWVRCLKLVELI